LLEVRIEGIAVFSKLSILVIIEFLVLFLSHLNMEAVFTLSKSIVIILSILRSFGTLRLAFLLFSHIGELVVTKGSTAVFVGIVALIGGLSLKPVSLTSLCLSLRDVMLTMLMAEFTKLVSSSNQERLKLSS